MSAMTNPIFEYDSTTNMKFPGDLLQGLSHMMDTDVEHQLINSLRCSYGGFLIPHETYFNMLYFVIVSLGLTGNSSLNEQKPKLVVPQEMCLKGQQYFLAGAVQMGLSGGHFLAIVNHYGAYAVLDDLDDTEVLYPTFAAAVSRLVNDTNMWKELQPYDAGVHLLVYSKTPMPYACLPPVPIPQGIGESLVPMTQVNDNTPVPKTQVNDKSPVPMTQVNDESPVSMTQVYDESPVPMTQVNDESPVPMTQVYDESPVPMTD